MTCLAIDDEPLALKLLTRYCSQIPGLQLLGAYTDPLESLAHIRRTPPDLLFLDIRMPDVSGLRIAQTLARPTLVIFTTAHKEYAVEGFDLDVVDYLLKPFSFDRFLTAYRKAEHRHRQSTPAAPPDPTASLTFRCNYRTVCLPLSAILYIEACNNYVKIVTADKTYLPALSMKAIQRLLPENAFLRVHKSYILSLSHIQSFNHEQAITSRRPIPIGRTYCKRFLNQMHGGSSALAQD